jgi:precorrin-6Y C5,15-methyltransferase (decarboxylating)
VAIARGIEQMDQVRFEAIHPTYLLAVVKTTEGPD